jgi:hypothetical protein
MRSPINTSFSNVLAGCLNHFDGTQLHLESRFERFFRADAVRQHSTQGVVSAADPSAGCKHLALSFSNVGLDARLREMRLCRCP